MKQYLNRCISFLLVLMMLFGTFSTAFASEMPEDSTIATEETVSETTSETMVSTIPEENADVFQPPPEATDPTISTDSTVPDSSDGEAAPEESETLPETVPEEPIIVTDEYGVMLEWGNLDPGLQYRLTETKAPEGFSLLKKPAFEGKLPADDLTVGVRVINTRLFTMPETGASSGMILRIASLMAALGCVCLIVTKYRKKKV